jgi:hypothetical protein
VAIALWVPSVLGHVNNLWDAVDNAHTEQLPVENSTRQATYRNGTVYQAVMGDPETSH